MEETIGYEALLSAEEWDSLEIGEWTERKTSLSEQDALRMASALEDYELVSVVDIGGSNALGFWITIRDERFGLEYEIASHCDYWDFISSLVHHTQPVLDQVSSGAVANGLGCAASCPQAAPEESREEAD